jgi:hypothetical protein
MSQAINIGERRYALLLEDDGFPEPEAPLKKADLMHDILSGPLTPVGLVVLGGHYDECKARFVEHLFQTFRHRDSGSGAAVEFLHL